MNMNDYQDKTPETVMYDGGINQMLNLDWPRGRGKPTEPTTAYFLRIAYCAGKLNGEAGEVAEEVFKALRDDAGIFTNQRLIALRKELGDVLWYVSQLHNELGLRMERTMELNLIKLNERKERDQLSGSGSNR